MAKVENFPPRYRTSTEVKEIDIKEVEKLFPNLYQDVNSIKGEINVCAVYNGKNLIHSPLDQDRERYRNTFVQNCYDIEIKLNEVGDKYDRQAPKVYEVGGKIKQNSDNHCLRDGSCCLGIFVNPKPQVLSNFILHFVLPYFVWHAYKQKYNKIPPWGEYPHALDKAIQERKNEEKNIGRNNLCFCGSGKKHKKCCMLKNQ